MPTRKHNIKFSYLYRDAGNYKQFGELIFANPDQITIKHIEASIRAKLIDGQWFYANEWNLPDLRYYPWDDELDHRFHEFEGISYTNESINQPFDLKKFLLNITDCI